MHYYQPIYNIAELCFSRKITDIVLCPGSRCAPLTLAFTRHPQLTKKTISDERSAGFIALGIAQRKKIPAVLVCTSGTAAYHFAPAVAEAYFSQTPLLVFTADRPAEWIGQEDGQTIYQSEIFGKHVKKSYTLPSEYDHPDNVWVINRIVNEAINLAQQEPAGPVHINAPFREPLYPTTNDPITFSENIRRVEVFQPEYNLTAEQESYMLQRLKQYHNILIVAGQHVYDPALLLNLEKLSAQHNIPLVADIVSNLHPLEKTVRHADLFLGQAPGDVKKTLRPDLLITFGKSVLSKNLKVFLRQHAPQEHWHFQPGEIAPDTFQQLTHLFRVTPASGFGFLSSLTPSETFENQKQNNYYKLWEIEERRALRAMEQFFDFPELGELELVRDILRQLPEHSNLHLANSMSVRYANFVGIEAAQKNIKVYANRGTSGIDGCTSTAVGHSLDNNTPNFLITGDVAFFYDRNAFWHNYPLPNLRVVLLNNHGGIIFGLIDGPGKLPEAEEFFITRQRLNGRKLCEEFDFDYLHLDHRRKMKNLLKDFFEFGERTKILELETGTTTNKTIFDNLKQQIRKSYER